MDEDEGGWDFDQACLEQDEDQAGLCFEEPPEEELGFGPDEPAAAVILPVQACGEEAPEPEASPAQGSGKDHGSAGQESTSGDQTDPPAEEQTVKKMRLTKNSLPSQRRCSMHQCCPERLHGGAGWLAEEQLRAATR